MEKQSAYKSSKINIHVVQPQLDVAKGHFTYLVRGNDSNGNIEIRRRFNDFYYLRQSLRKKWPGVYIAPIAEKMLTGNKDQGNIQIRRRYFQYFMQILAQSKYLYYCSTTQDFLRNNAVDMQKFYSTHSFPKPQQILAQYKISYPRFAQKIGDGNSIPQAQQKKTISNFKTYLSKAQKQLKTMKGTIQNIYDARNNFITHLTKYIDIVNQNTLPLYQKNVYSEYLSHNKSSQQQNNPQGELIFFDNRKVKQNVQALKQVSKNNSFESCLDMICYQLREIQSMGQLLSDRDQFEAHYHKCKEKLLSYESQLAKLMGGKTTLKSLFSKGNKDDQIKKFQKQIPELKIELQNWRRFVNTMSILISEIQIPLFKKYKQNKYYETMNKTSQKELNYLVAYGQLMKSVMKSIMTVK